MIGVSWMELMIQYRGIKHNVLNDAPFIGAIIIAPSCFRECLGCQNKDLKNSPLYDNTAFDIISLVKKNKFNQGIILAGLEWTCSPNEMKELIHAGLDAELQVMIYTYMTEIKFTDTFPDLFQLPIWVKFGEYVDSLKTDSNIQHGVKLATSNQCIKYMGGEQWEN